MKYALVICISDTQSPTIILDSIKVLLYLANVRHQILVLSMNSHKVKIQYEELRAIDFRLNVVV